MKHLIACLLTVLLVAGTLTACAKPQPTAGDDTFTVTASTMEDQLTETGLQLYAPLGATDCEWLILTYTDGRKLPQVNFTYEDIRWQYRAEKTNKTEGYNFSGMSCEWEETASCGYDDLNATALLCGTQGVLEWIADGVAYNVFSEACDIDHLMDIFVPVCDGKDFYVDPNAETTVDTGDWTFSETTGADLIYGLLRYDAYGSYIHVFGNKTYLLYDANRQTDGVIRFWNFVEGQDDIKVFYNEYGGEDFVLTATGTAEDYTITDESGDTLSPSTDAMNGTYYCFLNPTYLAEDGTLHLTTLLDVWIDNNTAETLAVGDTLAVSEHAFVNVTVESLVKESETRYRINESMILEKDEAACAWHLTEHGIEMWEAVGVCDMTEATVFTDSVDEGAHTTLADCLAAHDGVHAQITVKDGVAVAIDVVDLF